MLDSRLKQASQCSGDALALLAVCEEVGEVAPRDLRRALERLAVGQAALLDFIAERVDAGEAPAAEGFPSRTYGADVKRPYTLTLINADSVRVTVGKSSCVIGIRGSERGMPLYGCVSPGREWPSASTDFESLARACADALVPLEAERQREAEICEIARVELRTWTGAP